MSLLAVIFDYDDTLVPDSTTFLLKRYNIDTKTFWNIDFKNLVKNGYCPTHAYLKLLIDNIGNNKPLGQLTNQKLMEVGEEVGKSQYTGLCSLIRNLKSQVEPYKDIDIEFYIISSGLEEIIKGNKFIKKHFSYVYGCRLAGDDKDSPVRYIKRAITFTEKTRYLFEINKGISPEEAVEDPAAVNKNIPKNERRIPFENMIYIGDGITDIPCFSLLRQMGGHSFGIHHSEKTASTKMIILKEILQTSRVHGTYAPRYGKKDTLGDLIRLTVESKCADIFVKRKSSGKSV